MIEYLMLKMLPSLVTVKKLQTASPAIAHSYFELLIKRHILQASWAEHVRQVINTVRPHTNEDPPPTKRYNTKINTKTAACTSLAPTILACCVAAKRLQRTVFAFIGPMLMFLVWQESLQAIGDSAAAKHNQLHGSTTNNSTDTACNLSGRINVIKACILLQNRGMCPNQKQPPKNSNVKTKPHWLYASICFDPSLQYLFGGLQLSSAAFTTTQQRLQILKQTHPWSNCLLHVSNFSSSYVRNNTNASVFLTEM